jgi:hypothetical protein
VAESTDHAKLATLAQAQPAESASPSVEVAPGADLAKADEKLAALLGKPK